MIFPREYKEVGYASTHPCGNRVYFLSRYLVRETPEGPELLEVVPDPEECGLMRSLREERVLATADEVTSHPERVRIQDRSLLIRLASKSGTRCTIFTGLDEHSTFVLDPDPGALQTVHVYDVIPPRPSLSSAVRELEEVGIFGDLDVVFEHHLQDITELQADIYPCAAGGFQRTLDADRPGGGETVAGCLTGAQLLRECYGSDFRMVDICPLHRVEKEPFIARCCRKEREGVGEFKGKMGAVVHWGANPARIYQSVCELLDRWRNPA